MSKHPELHKDLCKNGVSYACAYMRLEHGWSLDRAVSEPPRKRGRKRGITRTMSVAEVEAAYEARWRHTPPRERPGYLRLGLNNRVPKRVLTPRVIHKQTVKPIKVRKQYTRHAEDTSPPHIRKLRAAYCDEFIKTGNLNPALAAQLKDYADACRATQASARGVSHEQTFEDRGRAQGPARNDSGRDAHQISGDAARRIADFLRT